jgi:broad specificity phosphatase PhoE
MTMTVVYETHSTTTDNEAGVATGWRPGELSARGRDEARALGQRRRDDGLAAVYVSDLARAVETVRIAFDGCDIPVHVDSRLRECDYGTLTGLPSADLAARRAEFVDAPYPGGESYRDVVTRTQGLLADLPARHDGERVLLVGHSANPMALDHLLAGRDLVDAVTEPFEWRPGWTWSLPS